MQVGDRIRWGDKIEPDIFVGVIETMSDAGTGPGGTCLDGMCRVRRDPHLVDYRAHIGPHFWLLLNDGKTVVIEPDPLSPMKMPAQVEHIRSVGIVHTGEYFPTRVSPDVITEAVHRYNKHDALLADVARAVAQISVLRAAVDSALFAMHVDDNNTQLGQAARRVCIEALASSANYAEKGGG